MLLSVKVSNTPACSVYLQSSHTSFSVVFEELKYVSRGSQGYWTPHPETSYLTVTDYKVSGWGCRVGIRLSRGDLEVIWHHPIKNQVQVSEFHVLMLLDGHRSGTERPCELITPVIANDVCHGAFIGPIFWILELPHNPFRVRSGIDKIYGAMKHSIKEVES